MSNPIEPALTPDEWEVMSIWQDGTTVTRAHGTLEVEEEGWYVQWHGYLAREHGIAALCLYGQPFGFTREDCEVLRRVSIRAAECDAAACLSVANRIEALLPPVPPTPEPLGEVMHRLGVSAAQMAAELGHAPDLGKEVTPQALELATLHATTVARADSLARNT